MDGTALKERLARLPRRVIDYYALSLDRNTIEYWQSVIFTLMTLAGAMLGTVCLAASVVVLIPRGRFLACALITAVYAVNVAVILARRIPLKAKTFVIAVNFYLFGVISLILGGPVGESGIWFSVTVLLCSLFINFRTSLAFAALNFLTGISFGFLNAAGLIAWPSLKSLPLASWFLQSGNIFLVGVMFAVADTVLIRGVGATFRSLAAAEANVRSSLAQKETLIRELYHRTKNNMQVVSSLLFLRSADLDTPAAKAVFKDVVGKIGAMSLVHEKLYESRDLSKIDFADYVRDLVALLLKSHGASSDRIEVDLDLESATMLIDTVLPCALVITEAVTNSLKYAFPGDRRGRISIRFRRQEDGTFLLNIGDDGIGVDGDFRFPSDGKMGMKTLNTIVSHQLHGDIQCSGEAAAGLAYEIRFKETAYEERVRIDGQAKEDTHR